MRYVEVKVCDNGLHGAKEKSFDAQCESRHPGVLFLVCTSNLDRSWRCRKAK
jgi:hypothetical protein